MSVSNTLRLLAGAACLALLSGLPAGAQEAQPEESARKLNTVTVTAQRRDESIQDVPLAVTAADAETIAELRISNVENISLLTPSISFRKTNFSASSSNIQIRGIGTTGNARTFEGAVGVFIDGVYRTRSGQALSNFLDIENLQVLRGPQGTLFGKNTSAGALLLSSTKPTIGEYNGFFEASFGNYAAHTLKAGVNMPLADNLALRVAGIYDEADGFFDNPNGGTLNDSQRDGIKAQLLWEPTTDLSVRLIADVASQDDNCCYGTTDSFDGPLQGFVDLLTVQNGLIPPSDDPGDFEAVVSTATPNKVDDEGLTLQVDWDVWGGTLKSVTAVREYDVFQTQDGDFSGADVLILDETFNSEFFSQELTFSGELTGAVNANYVLGAYYSDEDLNMTRDIFWGAQGQTFWDVVLGAEGIPAGFSDASEGLVAAEIMGGTSESIALFTHWDFALNDQWNLILGARYSDDEKTGFFYNDYYHSLMDPLALLGISPGPSYDQSFSDDAFTGTVSVQYRPNTDMMFYASYNRGYKAGGINLDQNAAGTLAQAADPSFKAETIDAYEIGAKIDWMDGAARTNVAFFYNDVQDLQIAQFLGLLFSIVNSPEGTVSGAEIEQTFALNDFLILNASATWLETAEYGDDPILGEGDSNQPELGGISGRRFAVAPELAANISLNLDYPIKPGLALTGLAQVQYTDDVFTNTASNLTQEAVTLVNANLGLNFEDMDMSISAFVRNATDETYVSQHFNTPLQGTDRNAYMGAPRTYGLMLRKMF